jgi:hypothetical protein
VPLEFKPGQNADTLGLTGKERYSFDLGPADQIRPGQEVTVKVEGGKISEFKTTLRFDTESEILYYKVPRHYMSSKFIPIKQHHSITHRDNIHFSSSQHGGVLNYVIRETLKESSA